MPKRMPNALPPSTSSSRPVTGPQPVGSAVHLSVLYHEIILALRPHSPGRYVDATLGAGGHARGILEACSPSGQLLGMDVDPQALKYASSLLEEYGARAKLVLSSYTQLEQSVHNLGWNAVDGVLIDLGVSSMQLDTPGRGFSFLREGPLDMRFNPAQDTTAAELVNDMPENELADIIWKYGEEPRSHRIARAILQARPLTTTTELGSVIQEALHVRYSRIHPATRTFQALRIVVNQELQALEKVLPQAITVLMPGGRLAVISFHSLEDRLVKQFLRRESQACICPPGQPHCTCGHKATLNLVNRRPIEPAENEKRNNPRSRSAKLRVAEKLKTA
jgi:16S rRNA (cytosine1402-N4)-methyltransferase